MNLFNGRLKRGKYFLQLILLSIMASILLVILEGTKFSWVILLLVPVVGFFVFSLHIRRLHDLGKVATILCSSSFPFSVFSMGSI